MKKIIMPDYTNCLINLMASIKRHFYLPYSHSTLKDIDRILDNGQYRSVVILLLDGMGSKILNKHFKNLKMSNQDRGLATEIVYGVVENKYYLDYIINKLSKINTHKCIIQKEFYGQHFQSQPIHA